MRTMGISIYIQVAPQVLAPRNADGLGWDGLGIVLTREWPTPVYFGICFIWRRYRCCPFWRESNGSFFGFILASSWRRSSFCLVAVAW